jgi:hypothetical protein
MCQQSPSFGSLPTGATSEHHFVTPTSERFAPIANNIDVALGASETIRSKLLWFVLITLAREFQSPALEKGNSIPLLCELYLLRALGVKSLLFI